MSELEGTLGHSGQSHSKSWRRLVLDLCLPLPAQRLFLPYPAPLMSCMPAPTPLLGRGQKCSRDEWVRQPESPLSVLSLQGR